MSLESQSRIFTKSNLVYIPLSITTAHTLNFIINSPLSTWQQFPPKLPDSIYLSIWFIPLLLFISLTFEPIRTRKRFYTLLSLALIYLSIPISFRKGNYPIKLQNDLQNDVRKVECFTRDRKKQMARKTSCNSIAFVL
ncbi:hypothetical protein RhiirA1_463493 [Rhizophagus irregularis]|uniref:Uncharacterized protein n=1 Tax=Rhizophagus irregularis TaxID=588596 RepID=A0A2N0RJY9_9GLOM|nr:hypothetical protein RhiirA1_463493 [Rhizophagus irregularis]